MSNYKSLGPLDQVTRPLNVRDGTLRRMASFSPGLRGISVRSELRRIAPLSSSSTAISVRSPVFEETVTQLSEIETSRSFTSEERQLAHRVFGESINYSVVRLMPTGVLEYRTVANAVRVPGNFTISRPKMAQTLIHELTHVWQYQHGGTRYMSISLGTQIAAAVRRGNRNFAYDYEIRSGQSFFDFTPEQQAFLVENYFTMLRDQATLQHLQQRMANYESNHLDASGFRDRLSADSRQTEITRELPMHEPLIRQMRAVPPRSELDLFRQRATEVMQVPGRLISPAPPEREMTPLKPLFEVTFP